MTLTLDPRIICTQHLVEATSCERQYLWQDWHKDVPWLHDSMGKSEQIATFGGMPIVLALF